jgi:hypothetical protein
VKRRKFIALLGTVGAWPFTAGAQQPAMPVIGFLSSRSPGVSAGVVAAFRQVDGAGPDLKRNGFSQSTLGVTHVGDEMNWNDVEFKS